MTKKVYDILLDNKMIGTTKLDKADPPMGVVFGNIHFVNIPSGYHFFKTYCQTNHIEIYSDYPEDRLIATANIPNLKVVSSEGIEISGQGTNIDGMDADVFEVIIIGVPSPLYEEEFPHHMKAYYDQF